MIAPWNEIVVEQLNATQWHARFPDRRASGVNDWCTAVAGALVWAELDGCAVVSVALDGTRMLLAEAPPFTVSGRWDGAA